MILSLQGTTFVIENIGFWDVGSVELLIEADRCTFKLPHKKIITRKFWEFKNDSSVPFSSPAELSEYFQQMKENPEFKMRQKKAKLSNLFKALELNPYIDDAKGRQLLRSESKFVESYKYSDAGFNDLMSELLRIKDSDLINLSAEEQDYKDFLTAETFPSSGVDVYSAIYSLLQ